LFLKSYTVYSIIYRYLESPKPQKPWKNKKQSQKSWGCLGNQEKKQNFEENVTECLALIQKIVFSLSFFDFKSQNKKLKLKKLKQHQKQKNF